MNSIERMKMARAGAGADHVPFLPTILEHAAAVIGVSPSAAARDAACMAQAHIEAWRRYGHDAVTVGIDVYNTEAEALGCEVRFYGDNSIPGIVGRPGADWETCDYLSELDAACTDAVEKGRLPLMLRAARLVKDEIGSEVPVGIGISGPFSVCCELMGFENFIFACMGEPEAAEALLRRVTGFLEQWCGVIVRAGLGVTLFESWAAPPLLTPALYRRFAAPWEGMVVQSIRQAGGLAPSLVIGGDTATLLEDILSTGTAMAIADYNADLPLYVGAARRKGLLLRGNIDPKLVAAGPVDAILRQADRAIQSASGYPGFVLGTGVLPYDTPPEHVLALREHCSRSGGR